MAEYIDKQTVIDTLDGLCDVVCQYSKKQRAFMCGACNLGSAFDVLQELPAADVRPVVRGTWDMYKDGSGVCSVCGKAQFQHWDDGKPDRFCHFCGAMMEES